MILQAYELGFRDVLDRCFKEDAVKNVLKIPKQVRVVALTPLGYPDEPPSPKDRKSLDQIVCFEKYE